MSKGIEIGVEVGRGAPVFVPLGHTIVTGQSQRSGKTTALETMSAEAGETTVVAFITKRGERSFDDLLRRGGPSFHEMAPFFEERGDWRFVAPMLESTIGERLKFERAWIMRACRGAETLADVLANAERLESEAKKAMDRDMFMQIVAYLNEIVPLVGSLPPSSRQYDASELAVNVMNVVEWPAKMQMLFIAATLARVAADQKNTVVVVPESWETIPERTNTPAKEAAVQIARKGAAVGNYLWLDSQDITGVSKEIIRQASVWLLGVQREANEIRRNIQHIPSGLKKPKPGDVAMLKLGEFFVCTPDFVKKVYVKPTWMPRDMAHRIALGQLSATEVAELRKKRLGREEQTAAAHAPSKSVKSNPPALPDPGSPGASPEIVLLLAEVRRHVGDMRQDIKGLSDRIGQLEGSRERADSTRALPSDAPRDGQVRRVAEAAAGKRATGPASDRTAPPPLSSSELLTKYPIKYNAKGWTKMEEELYQKFKTRLVGELRTEAPEILRLVVTKPELELEIKKETITVDGKTLFGRVVKLLYDGWFDSYRTSAETTRQINSTGAPADPRTVLNQIADLVKRGFLIKNSNGFKAVEDMKSNIVTINR